MKNYTEFLKALPLCAYKGEVRKFQADDVEAMLEAKPIVFLPEAESGKEVIPWKEGDPLDLPFKMVFLEYLGNNITSMSEGNRKLDCTGIMVEEKAPGDYQYALLLDFGTNQVIHCIPPEAKEVKEHFLGIVRSMLKRLYTEQVGTSVSRNMVKIRSGQGIKIKKRIGQIIYVSPKRSTEDLEAMVGKDIEWSHRWRVRGHWRKLPEASKIGKDREGNLIVRGFTWVTEHIKGPEEAPLVEKVRVVK